MSSMSICKVSIAFKVASLTCFIRSQKSFIWEEVLETSIRVIEQSGFKALKTQEANGEICI